MQVPTHLPILLALLDSVGAGSLAICHLALFDSSHVVLTVMASDLHAWGQTASRRDYASDFQGKAITASRQ